VKRVLVIIIVSLLPALSIAQKKKPSSDVLPMASTTEKTLYTFDIARPVEHFDATPSGDLWYAVDKFALLRTITVNGAHYDRHFNEIQLRTSQIAPSGNYMVWMGLDRSVDGQGFNTTTTSIFKYDKRTKTTDSLGSYHSDYNMVSFSPRCDKWAAILPAANVRQGGQRDVVMVDGKIVSESNPNPRKFTFASDCASWAYRSTDGRDENLITDKGKQLLYKRTFDNPSIETNDPVILHLSPETRTKEFSIEGRDFDMRLRSSAHLYRTSYLASAKDTTHVYIVFNGKRQFTSRWISDVIIDTAGKHIVYFANDTGNTIGMKNRDERGLVLRDGKVIAGPYESVIRLFLSPSGEHMAWTAGNTDTTVALFLDGKQVGTVGEYMTLKWSADEKEIVYSTMTDRGKLYVVAGGKRSASYDMLGQVGFTHGDKAVEFVALKYDKLVHVTQPF
jgi:hypothetical protein